VAEEWIVMAVRHRINKDNEIKRDFWEKYWRYESIR